MSPVVPGPGVPVGTPPGGRPRTRVLPPASDTTRAAGPGGPVGPVGGGPNGRGGSEGPGGSGDGSGDGSSDTTKASGLKADLSPTKIAAGAGAAIVTAVLGSFLGAVGTVVGAALGSVISTLATTLFTRSLEVSKDKALELKEKATRRGKGVAEGTAAAAQHGAGRSVAGPTGEETVLLDPWQTPGGTTRAAGTGHGRFRRVRVTRKTVIVSAVLGVVTFAVSMFLISGIEFVKGSSLSGSSGTSVSNVVRGGAPPAQQENDRGEGSGGDSSTSSSSSTSTEESGTSTSESTTSTRDRDSGQDGSGSSNPLQDGLNRVLPTQQPGSGQDSGGQDSGGQDSGGQDSGGQGSGTQN
ncbi:hypothetical protein [Pseudonocardia sp. HH130629-09]|uniref:hypothetical protein n=1 Tax=Pseudonocardia sp. HH130629-09 TaxID=1641402 RepID=UPI0006CB7CBE|nr:hypothetical protein [Pseudonocardia sp. HH130629-09]ALE86475.1 hypothetical protein XF36_27805 [Pseudonocardia sp. HH130629-09]